MIDNEVRISILGDICPVNRVEDAILRSDLAIFEDAREILIKQDLVIANLECPLTQSEKKIKKIGPNLKGHPRTTDLLKYLNINIAALANNHILDFKQEGLIGTIKLLNENKIEHIGAGINIREARRPIIKDIKGVRIGILNVCEREFNIAGDNIPGANPFDIISLLRDIEDCHQHSDFLILFYHGGIESYNLPSPEMYRNFEFLAGKGVDIIVCNHQHVIGGYQKIHNSHVFYGLGNFIFDWPSIRNNPWNYGLILNLTIEDKGLKGFELIPCEQCNDFAGIKINQEIRDKKYQEIDLLNSKITDEYIVREWRQFMRQKNVELVADFFIQNKYVRYILKKTGIIKILVSREHQRRIYNYFNCQSLSEFARDSLKETMNT
jgi:poly-gamma-glutamate capsule biosynthesis protein CapA/YwtB (metallophosphatase superfamily)